ncbi:hypothetical protein Q4E93_21130 [Flavitalea sp. BT771]|uniref:hypothetical protein n=1 Tax=Flavitalea sp. BT771 TaxID=3063329 RepID=UPI0026E3BB65|nr:hypothetical protein [Flavitalea sp. BT771]MDO6433126.1 hypothetical protein [Flavitalea sp. BT771]MDV6221598.1 hypothetical protein [Flavitalea sp. BT771]
MNIPLNGRIAIIDDKVEQAQPLMNVLAQKRCACMHYTGELRNLPEPDQAGNDIRILFLDINLLGNASYSAKQLKGPLVGVLGRVISKSNFPWVLIYWSRHEEEHGGLVDEIFANDLSDRKPIATLSQNKSDYFSMDGSRMPDFDAKVKGLFAAISLKLQEEPAYRHLIDWENLLHNAADKTLQDIFSTYHTDWKNNANYLIKRLGKSFAGKTSLTDTPEGMIRSAFQTLNNVFADTLEYSVNNTTISSPGEMSYNPEFATNSIYKVNKKLLLSDDSNIIEYSGMVIQNSRSSADKLYNEILNSSFNRARVKEAMDPDTPKKEFESICSKIRDAIRSSWKRLHLVVTPLCDVVQKKSVNIKVVSGFLIPGGLIKNIDERSEAVFISPKFQIANEVYALVLNLRYFYTIDTPEELNQEGLTPLFRVRQSLLAEIQSRLARHLSRQGVLFIDDNFS